MNAEKRRTVSVPHRVMAASRREFLTRAGGGFGALALAWLLGREAQAAPGNPVAAAPGHFRPRARSVIWLFMDGGPSHIDLLDPKPKLQQLAGQKLPPSFERPLTPMGVSDNPLLPSRRKFKQYGESGLWFSDWIPHIAQHADKLCVIRSCQADGLNHVGAVCQMNSGSILHGRPSLGAWVVYGLGSENHNLPAFVVLLDREQQPPGGARNWGTGFLPATYQGTRFRDGAEPVLHLNPPPQVGPRRQRAKLDLLRQWNRLHAQQREQTDQLEARIASYELAFRMQMRAPEAVDLSRETQATHRLYGLEDKATRAMGRACLLARRLVERGVRFVQVYCGSGSRWDSHTRIETNHAALCRGSDRPVAALLADLEQRGLLDETLVIWGGEFGRTPMSEKGDGRDHNPYGFSVWMAGGGVRGGQYVGSTDELGLYAVEHPVHVHDLHATILHLLGLDHRKLTFLHNGRDERATVDGGEVVTQVFQS